MNREFALDLIKPFRVGDTISEWTLLDIRVDIDPLQSPSNRVVYIFSPSVELIVHARTDAPAAAHTRNFSISVNHKEKQFQSKTFKAILKIIEQNDTDKYDNTKQIPTNFLP